MNVEIGTEAAQFPEKEHIDGIFLAVCIYHGNPMPGSTLTLVPESTLSVPQAGTLNSASVDYSNPSPLIWFK